jgi:hypothetical protein
MPNEGYRGEEFRQRQLVRELQSNKRHKLRRDIRTNRFDIWRQVLGMPVVQEKQGRALSVHRDARKAG